MNQKNCSQIMNYQNKQEKIMKSGKENAEICVENSKQQ